MSSNSLGSFSSYKHPWSRHRQDLERTAMVSADTVWVTKRYIPTDLRVTAPVPRHKLISLDVKDLAPPESHWIQPGEAMPWSFSRNATSDMGYTSQPSTRCEEWSTLRQMLPSDGRVDTERPPNWGTGFSFSPARSSNYQRRFPHVNSPMTRYTDDMHLTNRLFKLH